MNYEMNVLLLSKYPHENKSIELSSESEGEGTKWDEGGEERERGDRQDVKRQRNVKGGVPIFCKMYSKQSRNVVGSRPLFIFFNSFYHYFDSGNS